ncbi:MAG: glucose-1-phosphate cytidylyltransferase [Gaiellaceae bacterium]
MKAVILAGGTGARIAEETDVRPKPMIEIGGKPILWHIMKLFSVHSINDFIVCLGYKGYMIKEYFANYYLHMSDVTFDIGNQRTEIHESSAEPWRVTLVDTGEDTQTGGRLKRVLPFVQDDEAFCLTYGDGVSDIDIGKLIDFHFGQQVLATVTAVQPPGRFGALGLDGDRVTAFSEKPQGDAAWINGGFFVLSPRVGEYISGDDSIWEREPLESLARDGQLASYRYDGFWQPMDTLREKRYLEQLWESGGAPWLTWE